MADIVGSLVTGVKGIGTSEGDTHAFLEMELHGQENTHYLMFEPHMGPWLIAAVEAASSHLEQKREMRGIGDGAFAPIPMVDFQTARGDIDGERQILMVGLSKSQMKMHFAVPFSAARRLIDLLQKQLDDEAAEAEKPN